MTQIQIYGLLYDVIFVALFLLVVRSSRRKGFVSCLLELCALILGVLAGVWASRVVAPVLYRDHVGVAIAKQINDTVAGAGADLSNGLNALAFLPKSVVAVLNQVFATVTGDLTPAIVNALEPVVLPIVQGLVFLVVCLAVRFLAGILGRLTRLVNKVPLVGAANKTLGTVLGVVLGLVDCWLLAMVLWVFAILANGGYAILDPLTLDASHAYTMLTHFNPFIMA